MDKELINSLPSNFKDLPKNIQAMIFDGTWLERVGEIARKYAINDTQTDKLIDETLFVLIGLSTPENFEASVTNELEISKLLAEQIVNDLEKRVFEYALNFVDKKDNKDIGIVNNKVTSKIEPNNVSEAVIRNSNNVGIPTYTPENLPTKQPQEEIQRPVPVPRFHAVPMETELDSNPPPVPSHSPKIEPVNMMDSKLKNITTNATEKAPPDMPTTKYSVDPYRESADL